MGLAKKKKVKPIIAVVTAFFQFFHRGSVEIVVLISDQISFEKQLFYKFGQEVL